jgi:transposase-like protein
MAKMKRIRRSAAVWRELFARQASSGVAVAEFCRREPVNANVFRRWRVMLKAADQRSPSTSVVQPGTEIAAPLIDLGGLGSREARFEVRLELGAGMVLSIARG